jgi:hypothetical protein
MANAPLRERNMTIGGKKTSGRTAIDPLYALVAKVVIPVKIDANFFSQNEITSHSHNSLAHR